VDARAKPGQGGFEVARLGAHPSSGNRGRYLADRGAGANRSAAHAAAMIFRRTSDTEARLLCLEALYKINNKSARNALVDLYNREQPQSEWRAAISERLRKAVAEQTHIKPAEARSVLERVGRQ